MATEEEKEIRRQELLQERDALLGADAKEQRKQELIAERNSITGEQPVEEGQKGSAGEAFKVGAERELLFGTRPTVAGPPGEAVAEFVMALDEGEDLGGALKRTIGAFQEARQRKIKEEEALEKEFPKATLAGQVTGGILTSPLTPIKAAKGVSVLGRAAQTAVQAAKVGGIRGAGEAVGKAESIEEGVKETASGAAFGVAGLGLAKAVGGTASLTVKGIKKVFPAKTAQKIAETMTGVPGEQIETFAKNTKEVSRIIRQTQGQFAEATDMAKDKLAKDIQTFRKGVNKEIGDALETASPEKIVNADPIRKALNKSKSQIDADLNPEQVAEIDEILEIINKKFKDGDTLSLKELFDIKDFLQDRAKGAFRKQGQIFTSGKKTQRAARSAAAEAKKILDRISPEIKEANAKLAKLHAMEETMNKQLLKVGGAEASFLAAGSGLNKRNEKLLKALDKLTGSNSLEQAKKLSAARQFTDPSLIPQGTTGLTATRLLAGGAIGGAIGAITGDESKGILIGAALSSPAALKALIKGSDITDDAIKATISVLDNPQVLSFITKEASKGGVKVRKIKRRLNDALRKGRGKRNN